MLIFSQHLRAFLPNSDKEAILSYIDNKDYLENKHDQFYAIRKSNGLSFKRIDVYVNPTGLIFAHEGM